MVAFSIHGCGHLGEAGHQQKGNTDLAEQRLVSAERAVRRARINGVDDADIYYTESSIQALRGEPDAALSSLQIAYDKGFRGGWKLDMDLRMGSLRQEPQFVAIRQQIKSDIEQADKLIRRWVGDASRFAGV